MTNNSQIVEHVATAIYNSLFAQDYLGQYKEYFGSTTIDGQFDLDKVAAAAISPKMSRWQGESAPHTP